MPALTINTPPKAEPERLSRLVERINAGEIKIPKFQRNFVWGRKDVLELLESVLQGYPIGSLLFWRTEQKLNIERNIHGFELPPTPDKYPVNYVLDGQQRLTTVYGVLSYTGPEDKPHILSVVYDLRKNELRHRQPADGIWCLPLNVMFDFTRLNQYQTALLSLPDGKTLNGEALRVNETFREYQVPVVTLTDRTLDEVCPIFERINSTGRKLTVFDLMVAATFSHEFDLNDEVRAIDAGLAAKDFRLDGDSILRTVSAIRNSSVKKGAILSLRKAPHAELRDSLTSSRKALEKAIDFLRVEVGVVTSDFLPYDAHVTVLCRIFSMLKGPLTPQQRALLRSWFWVSAFHERYRGASDSKLDEDIERCTAFVESSAPLVPVRALDVADLEGKDFRKGTAITHAFVALLVTAKPVSIADGSPIDAEGSLSWENQREFHHVFPKAYLATCSEDARKRQNDIANIILLPSAPNKDISSEKPSVYMGRLRSLHGDAFDSILGSNLIPPLEDSGLLIDDLDYFLAVRRDQIVQAINQLAAVPQLAGTPAA